MAHVYFDTLKFVEKLKASGMPESQAKALVEVQNETLSESLDTALATKTDVSQIDKSISDLSTKVNERFTQVESEIRLLKWMMGFILAGIGSLVAKAFF